MENESKEFIDGQNDLFYEAEGREFTQNEKSFLHLLALIGSGTRLRILYALSNASEGMRVLELVEHLREEYSLHSRRSFQATVSNELQHLRRGSLVSAVREGKGWRYTLNRELVTQISEELLRMLRGDGGDTGDHVPSIDSSAKLTQSRE